MLETALDHFTLQSMEKKSEESYREYAIRWKAVASQVWPALTNKETNSLFVDTLHSPYYDILIGNAFHEFEDLLYFVGRIEGRINKGMITNTRARMLEKKRNVVEEHIQATSIERRNKKKFNEEEVVVKNLPYSSLHVPFLPLQISVQGNDLEINSGYL